MLSSRNKSLGFPRLLNSSSGISFFDRITNNKYHFPVNNKSNIECRFGFRAGSKLSPGKVPKDMDIRSSIAAEFFIPIFLPKNEGFDMEMKKEGGEGKGGRRRGREMRARIEVEEERVTKEGTGPGEGEKA